MLILVKVGVLYVLLANPFAPLPLQLNHHYYGLVCPCMRHRFTASGVCPLRVSLCILKQVLKFRNQARIKFLPSEGRLPYSQ